MKITKEDLTPDLLKAFMDCTHGIIDLVIGLYSAIQHEALITDRKTKTNDAFVRKVAKKYYPNLMKTIDGIDASGYDRTRLSEIEEANILMKKTLINSLMLNMSVRYQNLKTSHLIRICLLNQLLIR